MIQISKLWKIGTLVTHTQWMGHHFILFIYFCKTRYDKLFGKVKKKTLPKRETIINGSNPVGIIMGFSKKIFLSLRDFLIQILWDFIQVEPPSLLKKLCYTYTEKLLKKCIHLATTNTWNYAEQTFSPEPILKYVFVI